MFECLSVWAVYVPLVRTDWDNTTSQQGRGNEYKLLQITIKYSKFLIHSKIAFLFHNFRFLTYFKTPPLRLCTDKPTPHSMLNKTN